MFPSCGGAVVLGASVPFYARCREGVDCSSAQGAFPCCFDFLHRFFSSLSDLNLSISLKKVYGYLGIFQTLMKRNRPDVSNFEQILLILMRWIGFSDVVWVSWAPTVSLGWGYTASLCEKRAFIWAFIVILFAQIFCVTVRLQYQDARCAAHVQSVRSCVSHYF